MRHLAALALVVGSLLAGCGGSDEASDTRTTVVAAFYPLAWAAEQIGGDGLEVVNLTPPGAEPHDVELSPRDVEEIHDAELVLYVGGGFQPALEDALRGRDGPALDVLPDGQGDPHVWLDPVLFSRVVQEIGAALDRPKAAGELAERLLAVDAVYQRDLRSCARRTFVTAHAAFGHLARAYDLEQLSLEGLTPEAEPAPRELERLVDEVRGSGATTVFFEPLVSPELAETVAREAGVATAELDPVEGLDDQALAAGADYVSLMRDNLAALRKALGCR
jgi:zinc transport system substrate-binding protein